MGRPPSMPVVLTNDALGRRVAVRYRRGVDDGAAPLTDVVGVLTARDADSVTVLGRRGPITVAASDIVTARVVAPSTREILDLERIAADGWRSVETVERHGWLLRADHGWTGRANSALPLGVPTGPLSSVLSAVTEFYRSRGLQPQIMVPMPGREPLDAELAALGWTAGTEVVVMTRPLPLLLPAQSSPQSPELHGDAVDDETVLTAAVTEEWSSGYRARDGVLPPHALALIQRHDTVRFATVRRGGQVAGIARGVVDDGWLGLTMIETAPQYRRSGVGTRLVSELARWGQDCGASSVYLQVAAGNGAALSLYRRLGCTEHHRYRYRLAPA